MMSKRTLVRTAAYGGLLGLLGLALFALFGQPVDIPPVDQQLDRRTYVGGSRLRAAAESFDAHFRVDAGHSVWNPEVEIPWNRVMDLFPTAQGVKRGLRLDYGLDDGHFKLAWSSADLTLLNPPGTYNVTLFDPLKCWLRGDWVSITRKDWEEEYQDRSFGTWGRYWREMEIRRHESSNFERVQRGDEHGDPRAELFAWEDEIMLMYDANKGQVTNGEKLFLVAKCFSEPADPLRPGSDFQHRICLFLRVRDNDGILLRDLLDDVDRSATPQAFLNKGADFGNLCPPTCNPYILPNRLKELRKLRTVPDTTHTK
jgi:hypothetical protein